MNKIFKVVWSKTKECYVVVSEVAKNNGGKKKALASVLAGLAMVGAGAQVQAYSGLGGHDNPAVETLAVGPDTWANQEAAVAVGMHNNANGQPAGKHSVAIGSFSNANGEISIAMGGVTNASGKMSVAVGYRASATDEAAVALGNMVSADKNSTGVGPGATASGTYAFAGGYQSETTGISGVAIGDNAKAKAARAMAIGGHAEATAEQAIAIGSDTGAGNKTTASKKNAIAVGHGATASGLDTAAIGTSATASGQSSVALGNGTQSTNLNTTAIGSNVQSTKTGSIGIGGNVESIGDYSVAIGSASAGKTVKAVDYATAVGGLSNAAERAAALGAGANAAQARSVAVGYKATANTADGVAIGSTSVASTAAGVQGFDSAENRTRKYTALTGNVQTSTLAAVSVGNGSTATRQITGLAAGKEDTDAVNVAQLKNVGVRVGADTNTATIGTTKVAADFLAYNGQLNIKGDSNRVTTESSNDANGKDANVNVKFDYDGLVKAKTGSAVTVDQKTDAAGKTYFEIDAAAASKTVVANGKNTTVTGTGTTADPYKVNVEGALTGISSITNNSGGKIEFSTGGTTISGGPVNVSNNKITGVANGDVNATSTDAVNGSQLHAVKAAERHIAPTTTGHEYTVDGNGNVTMTYLDGNNNAVTGEQAVIKGIAKQDLSNITNEGKKEITKLGTIVKAGDNVTVTSVSDGTTGRTTYTVNAVTPAIYTDKNGNKVVKRSDGTYTTNLDGSAGNDVAANDVIVSFKDAAGNTTGGGSIVNNVGSAIKNQTGATYLDKLDAAAGDTKTQNAAVNVTDLKSTADGLTNKGLKFNANEGGVQTNKLGSTVTVQGSGALTAGKAYADEYNTANIRTKIEQGTDGNTTINVGLAKELKDINSISNGGSSITISNVPTGTTTPAVTISGGNLSMGNGTTNNKIVNLAPGTGDNDAVNVKQLKDTELHITPGTYTPGADKKVKLTYTDGNNTVVNGKEAVIDLSGLATGGATSTEKVQAKADVAGSNDKNIAKVAPKAGENFGDVGATYEVNVSRNDVKDAAREAITINNGGTTTGGAYTADTNNPISVTPTQDNNNHNTTYAVTFDGNKAAKQIPLTYKANGNGAKTVTLEKGLDFTNGTNTTAVIDNDGVVKYNLNKDVDLSNTGSLTVGGTKVNNGGVTITAPTGGTTTDVKLTNTGLDNGGNKIINVAPGTLSSTSTDAVNGSQLYTVDQKFNNKINLGADGNTETTKLALDNNGGIKFNIKGDGSGASGANQYISTTANGSDIKVDLTQDAKDKLNKTYEVKSTDNSVKVTTTSANGVTTFDLKVTPATGTTSTWDIKSSADTANGGATATGHETNAKTIANTNSVEMIAGKNLTVKQTSDTNGAKVEFALSDEITVGKDGANGVDGKIGVNGKDGASVVINGKDGSIGLTGAPGTPGAPGASATLKVKDGVPGVDGAPGTNLTRIVYTDKNNVEHEVATHDDGMKFAGDDGQTNQATNTNVIKKHLNNVVDIIGGATKADLTTNNIGVNNDGNGKLLVQLSKNLNGINTIKNGGTTITLNDAPGGATNTPAVTISGGNLSVGGNKVTNVDDGTNDSDAVNLKQLKAAKTEVKAGENVTVKHTTDTTDNHNIYTVSAVTPAVYTKADGTKVYKIVDPTSGAVTWNTSPDGNGTVVNAGDVITSFETPANGTTKGSTTGGTMIVNNVGSAINNHATPGVTSPTYLDKLDAAAGDNNTKHAAVNVTDLKNTADALTDKGLKFDANVGGVKTNKLGSTVKVQGAGTSADANYSGANIKTFIDQDATGNTTIDVKLDKNLAGINSITGDTNSGKLVFQDPTATGNNGDAFKFTGGNINAGGNNITNLKSGIVNNNATDDTNGANIGDVKKIAKASDLHIAPTAGTTNNVTEYTVDANNKVTLTYQDGNGTAVTAPKAVIDLSALANKITSGYTFNANATANGGTVANDATTPAAVTAVANGGTINYAAGKNLTVKQDIDATNKTHTYTYSLDKDLTNLDKVVVNGKDGIAGKDGVTIVGPQGATGATGIPGTNGIDGKVGIAGKDGKDAISIAGKDGVGTIGLTGPQGPAGTNGKSVDISTENGTQTLVKPEANNNDQSQRIVYVPKDKDGNPLKDDAGNTIKREVATMDDGLKFAGDDGQANQATNANVIKKQLNNVVDIIGGANKADLTTNNIGVNNDGNGKLLVQLSKNLNGINTIKNGGTTITLNDAPGGATNTPAVTISGGNLSVGGNKVTNVDDGTNDSDAVNLKQLKAAKTEVKAGENVTVKHTTDTTDNHNIYTVSAVTPAVYTKADGTKVYKIVDPITGAVTWNTSPDGTGTVVNAGDVITSFESPANGTTPGSTTGGNMIVNNVGSAIKNQTGGDFLAKLDAAANTTTGTPNAAVNVSDLKNTADALKANERHIAPTTVATGSTETKGGTANAGGTNVYKYDAASKTVTLTYNDGNGNAVTDTKAVIDLSNLSTGGTGASSWNVKSSANTTDGGAVDANHNANAQNIADGKSVEFQSGKNLVVKQTNDTTNGNATVEFSLSDNITVGKDGANGKDGSVGAKGADGSAVVMNGKDGSIGLNGTNGANGISIKGKDGANGVGIDGKDGVTRIVYTEKVPDPANPGTTKEVTHEVATMDDGLKFTGNNTGTVNKHKLGSLVKVQGEGVSAADEAAFVSASGNIAVTAENNDTLTIRLNKNLKGLNSIQLGGNTIQSNGDNITFTTNGGTTKTVATTDQLWTIQANGTDVPATNGKVNVVGKDGITVAKNAAGNLEISGAGLGTMNGFDVTANNGATSKTITDGKKVDFNAGSNLTVKQTSDANGTHIEYALKEAVDLGTNGSLKAGDTTVNKDGVTITNGPSITKTGVDAGDKKITNVADGAVNATSKDAVNGSQLKKYTDAAKTTVEAGDNNVKVETDNSAADGHTNYKVSLEPVVTIGDTHKVKIDGHTGDITGLTNVNLTDPTFATKGRAATEEQLKQVLTEAKNKAIEKVQAGTAAAGDTNIATVAPKAGDTFGTAGATYEVSVSKNAVKDAAKEAVKVTSVSPAITVTPDTSVAHETTYKVGFDGNQAATQIPLTYKQNGGNTRTVKLSDGLNFIDGTNTKARTAADGKVTFDVMGDLTGITSISNAAGGPKMTFGGNSINVTGGNLDMGGKKITNLATGTAKDDAATVGQLTKVTSNNHSVVINKTTDADGAPVYDLAVSGTPGAPAADPRVDMLGEEIGRVGAQGAALSALKPIQYDPLEPTQIMAGYGNYRGNSAVALGVAHYKNESTLIHGGVSWAGGSSHMMANAGVTWKVGNRDSEAAVADRYRKGPISSAYAMQQEMAAMKAQNAGLKGEVSDLKAENEQMKAQIAAMMAKLGL